MKKLWPFLCSLFIALAITVYHKKSLNPFYTETNPTWKTFVKNSKKEITAHQATQSELDAARIPSPNRSIASESSTKKKLTDKELKDKFIKDNHFLLRENRVLLGDLKNNNYQDESTPLEMVNQINPNWKDILGHELLRFQYEDTKVMIKEEFPIIQVINGQGRYVEQVVVTYLSQDGSVDSYRALINSENGAIIETWDRTIHERYKKEKNHLTLPLENNSGIIVR